LRVNKEGINNWRRIISPPKQKLNDLVSPKQSYQQKGI
jgi:hypothetical protein